MFPMRPLKYKSNRHSATRMHDKHGSDLTRFMYLFGYYTFLLACCSLNSGNPSRMTYWVALSSAWSTRLALSLFHT